MNKKAIISLSGGLDSTCLLMKLLSEGYEVRAYAFNYGQKHTIELKKVRKNISFLKKKGLPVSLQVLNLKSVFSDSNSSLKKGSKDEIPEGNYNEENMKSTVVENRNIIFSSIIYGKALSWANATNSNVVITQGIHRGDHSIYPDTTPESRAAAEHLYKISNWGSEKVDFIAPFENITKTEVLKAGLEAMEKMGFYKKGIHKILSNTHSCYNPDEEGRSCGKCGTCIEENQRVLMADNTWKAIKDIQIGDLIWGVDEETNKIQVTQVLNKMDNGIKPVYDMNGLLLTSNHKVYASSKKQHPHYREYGNMNRKNAHYLVKYWPVNFTRNEVDERMFALGYLRGFADGDGSYDRGINVVQKEPTVLNEFWELYSKYISPCDVNVKFDEIRNIYTSTGGYAVKFLEETKFNTNPEYLRGYLNGILISDGGAFYNKSNKSFGFGIAQSNEVNEDICINIDSALIILGFTFDKSFSKSGGFRKEGCEMCNWRITRPYRITLKYGTIKKDNMLSKLSEYNSIRLLESKSVNKISDSIGERQVYDITTGTHSFICEGYLVHNCRERIESFHELGLEDPIEYQ